MAREVEVKLKVPKKDFKKGDLPDSDDEWVEYINRCHDTALHARKKFEFQWTVNLAYYMGYQHLLYNPRTGLLELPKDIRTPLTINRIGSFIEARHAKITKTRPIPRVVPNSTDPQDVYAAEYAQDSLMHLWRKTGQENEYDKLIMMMLLFGTAFKENVWDPFTGDVILEPKKNDSEDELVVDEDGDFEEEIFMGEVSSRATSPFNILPANDMIPDVKDQPWMMKRLHMPVISLEQMYPHLRGEIAKEDPEVTFTEHEKIVQRLSSPIFHMTGSMSQHGPKDGMHTYACVKTFMMQPNYQYEKGVLAVVIGKKLAMIDKFPNDWGQNIYPWVKFSEKQTGLHFWPQATLERQIPIQRAYNRLKQQKAKNAALMANLKWMVPKGAQVMEESLNDEEGEVVEYNSAVPEPHPAQVAPMPNYVSELARELIVDFRDVGGQRESSVTPPPNVTAGVAMQTAAELADEVMGPIIRRVGSAMEIDANQQLLLMNQEWTDPRKIKILGDDGKVGVEWLSSADFRNHTDVHIEIESLYPELRGAKRQFIMDIWDRRMVEDPKKVLRAIHYGKFEMLLEDDTKQEETIQLGIAEMKRGKEVPITPFDNHMMWIDALTKFMKTPEFLRLIPERKQLFIMASQQRLALVMQQMPGGGAPVPQQNQAAVNTPSGPAKPVGLVK